MENKKQYTSSLITIDQNTFNSYFETSISHLLETYKIDERTTYKEFNNQFNINLNNNKENQDISIITNYYKLLDSIQCTNFKETGYYKYIQQHFIRDLLDKPAFFILLLSALLNKNFVKDGFLEIYRKEKEPEIIGNNRITTLIANKNSGIYTRYLGFLKGQFDIASEIFYGVFELAKNIVEHTTTKEGRVIIKYITKDTLVTEKKKRKKQDPWKTNPELWKTNFELWKDYFEYIEKQKLEFLGNKKTYLEISVVDFGVTGIIETSLNNLENPNNSRKLPEDIKIQDIETIKESIKLCTDNNAKEAELLFNMYFDRGNKLSLNRQARSAYKGLGIQIFTKFINDNYGIFNVETFKFKNTTEKISFSYRKGSEIKPASANPALFGTRYNIIIPLRKKIIEPESKADSKKRNQNYPISKGVYEQMLPLEIRLIQQNEKEYPFGELDAYKLPKYVIRDMQTGQDKILVISFRNDNNASLSIPTDRCKIFRTISLLFLKNKSIKAIIIKDIAEDLINGLFKLYTDFVLPQNNENNEKNKIILLIAEDKKEEKKKEKSVITGKEIAVIAGENEEDCRKINQYISSCNEDFTVFPRMCLDRNLSEQERERINNMLDSHILFSTGQLIALDFFEQGDSYFENEAKEKLDNLLDEKTQGYKWENTHLRIGSKLHLDDFVYGKKMFQQSKEVSSFAFLLSRHIYKNIYDDIAKISKEKEIVYTLIGYGYYSELLVSQTRGFVERLFHQTELQCKPKIEYVIVRDEDKISFSRYIHDLKLRDKELNNKFKDKKEQQFLNEYEQQLSEEKLIIIVPISSTLTTCLKIENAFHSMLSDKIKNAHRSMLDGKIEEFEYKIKEKEYNSERFKIQQPFYTIVVVGDNFELKELQEHCRKQRIEIVKHNKKTYNLLQSKYAVVGTYWQDISNKQIITWNREKKKERRNQFNIYIQSKWRQPDDCEHCFPNNPIQERPLIVTDKVSVTPTLIFDSPKWHNTYNDNEFWEKYKPYFKFKKDPTKNVLNEERCYPIIEKIDWVHYTGEDKSKHFNYYLDYLDLIKKNKEQIEKWARDIKRILPNEKKVLLIAPDKSENGAFIHLINREVFDNNANIIRFDKNNDHYLNFYKFFKENIKDEDEITIYFIDNLMISGKIFLLLNSILKVLQEEVKEEQKKKRINGIFCLINRMDYSSYNTITDCLQKNNVENDRSYLHSFINLYVPEETTMPCPLCDEKDKYEELIEKASLDCVKQYFAKKELPYCKEIEKEDLVEGELPYKPKNQDSTLLKVALIHFINKALTDKTDTDSKILTKQIEIDKLPNWAKSKNSSIDIGKYLNFNKIVNSFRKYISKQGQCNINGIDDGKQKIINELKFKANLLKILSSQSFKKYRGLYISVFYWVLNDLVVAVKTILKESNYKHAKEQTSFRIINEWDNQEKSYNNLDNYIDTVNYLRVLIKCASSLNIAYLLHEDFLTAINNLSKTFNKEALEKFEEIIRTLSDQKLLKKYENMRYSFENFKLFCVAHIIRSLHNNEQRAIRLEKNIKAVLKKEEKDTSFLELLILENTSIIRQTLDNFNPRIRDIRKILSNKPKHKKIKQEFLKKMNNYRTFMGDDNSTAIRTFCDTYKLRDILLRIENKAVDKEKKIDFAHEAQGLIKTIASIVGYTISDQENSHAKGGGLLLYKYQSIPNDNDNYIVVANVGDTNLANQYVNMSENCLATKILNGKNYLTENTSTNHSTSYTWTNYSVFLEKDKWKGQDGADSSTYPDIIALDMSIMKRILFIRISHFDKDELKGDAIFVLYDSRPKDKYHSVLNIRFVHTLRKEINAYFKERYEKDLFRAWVEEKRIHEDLISTEHHYKHHMKALYECAMENSDKKKLKFFYNQVYDAKEIKDFMKNGDSVLSDIKNIKLKEKIDEYCDFLLEPIVLRVKDNRVSENMTIYFSEMIFREIICEYLANINDAMRLYIDTLGIKPYLLINAEPKDHYSIVLTIENNFLIDKAKKQTLQSINKQGYLDMFGGLSANKKLLEKIGFEKPYVRMDKTDIDGIG
ncbi:MAG: hypothetical protein FWC41_02420, partial [Firmicutes bacterium]|nr:hypothetical protein [Bacillota bacterium]